MPTKYVVGIYTYQLNGEDVKINEFEITDAKNEKEAIYVASCMHKDSHPDSDFETIRENARIEEVTQLVTVEFEIDRKTRDSAVALIENELGWIQNKHVLSSYVMEDPSDQPPRPVKAKI